MSTIQTLYASGGDCPLHTLQIINSDLPVGQLLFAQSFDDVIATLETGLTVTFSACGMALSLPSKNGDLSQELQFGVDNVSGEALGHILAISEGGKPTTVVYRVYHPADLTSPAEPPVVMTGVGCKITPTQAGFRASFYDLLNKAWPRRRHTPAMTPGLRFST